MNPWSIDSKLYPVTGRFSDKLKFLLKYAILAPSGHNSQPWNFKIDENRLIIIPDYNRIRTMVDPDKRELFISIGAVSKNLELAADYFGLGWKREIDNDKVVFEFEELTEKVEQSAIFEAITKRRTYRGEFKNKKILPKVVRMIKAVVGDKTKVELIDNRQKSKMARLIHDSDLVWYKSRDLMNELAEWMRDDISLSADGLPTSMISMYKIAVEVKYLFSKDGATAVKQAKNDMRLTEASPILAVIVSKNDSVEEWVEAGETYETLALTLANMGLTNGLFNSVVELNGQRKKFAKLFGIKGKVQMMMRIGYPTIQVKPTPRRSVEELLIK